MTNLKITLLNLGILTALNAHAFTDNEARKAILDLRDQFKATVQTVQEQQNRITQLNDELSKLRGQYEQTQRLLTEVKTDQEASYSSVDKRLAALEPVPKEVLAQNDFDAAMALIQQRNYADALKAFDKHVKRYPNSTQTPEIIYWQGTVAYAVKNYKLAISRLTTFLTQYPNHEKSADALLTLGGSQIESGKKNDGIITLRQLINTYPKSNAAKAAADLL